MSTRPLVTRWRLRLLLSAVAAAAMGAFGVGLLVSALTRVYGGQPSLALVITSVATVFAGWMVHQLRGGVSLQQVALWLEGRVPALRFALVSGLQEGPSTAWCEQYVARQNLDAMAWRAMRRAFRLPVALLAVGLASTLLPSRLETLPRRMLRSVGAAGATALTGLRVRVAPPVYAGIAPTNLGDVRQVRALVGSTVEVEGPAVGDMTLLRVQRESQEATVAQQGERWMARFVMDSQPEVVRMQQGENQRLLVLEPVTDSAPTLTLELPVRDTVMRVGRGTIPLRATAQDDLGLRDAFFDYIVTSGEGERFTFRSGRVSVAAPVGRQKHSLSGALDLVALQLQPGDVVHVRAIATDGNTVNGPGRGTSDTRSIRVARTGEYDSVAVDAAPPARADSALLSQRMIINLTEALVKRSRQLQRPTLLTESGRLSRDQARLRKVVSDVVFSRLGDQPGGEHFHGDGHNHGEAEPLRRALTPDELLQAAERATQIANPDAELKDETPIVAINTPLLEAYNAMWEAGRQLDAGAPAAALPPMYVALAAIQRARAAERLYLRGAAPRVVIDLQRVRLQGKERGRDFVSAARTPRELAALGMWQRLTRVLSLSSGSAAADSVLLIRVATLADLPAAAAALDTLAATLRDGKDATVPVLRVRRALTGSSTMRDTLGAWVLP